MLVWTCHSYPYEDLLSRFLIRRDFSLNTLLGPPGFDGVRLQLFHHALPDLADQGASIAGFGLVVKCFDDMQGILMFFLSTPAVSRGGLV